MDTITRKTIDAFWARAKFGTRLTCLANTYNRYAPGKTGTVARPGKTAIAIRTDDGHLFWINPPRNVRDVVALDGDTITYRIGRDHHTATWQIVTPA